MTFCCEVTAELNQARERAADLEGKLHETAKEGAETARPPPRADPRAVG